jgi:hypothetical protein
MVWSPTLAIAALAKFTSPFRHVSLLAPLFPLSVFAFYPSPKGLGVFRGARRPETIAGRPACEGKN